MERGWRNTVVFLSLTVLTTWLMYFVIILFGWSPYAFPGVILLFFGGSTPSWIGVIMVLVTYDRAQRKDYFQRVYQLKRIKPVWWLALLLLFTAVTAVSVGLALAAGGQAPGMVNLMAIFANPLLWFPLVGLSFLSGPFSEELGWRGFALDPLLRRFGFARSGLLLGLVWGLWHLPLFFMPETWHGQIGWTGFLLFMLLSVGLTYIMSWVFVNNGRSILTAMLLHLSSNFAGQLVASGGVTGLELYDVFRCLLVGLIGIGIAVHPFIRKKIRAVETDSIAPDR